MRPEFLAGGGIKTKDCVLLLAAAPAGIAHRVGAPISDGDRGKPGADLGLPQPLGAVVGPLCQPAGLV